MNFALNTLLATFGVLGDDARKAVAKTIGTRHGGEKASVRNVGGQRVFGGNLLGGSLNTFLHLISRHDRGMKGGKTLTILCGKRNWKEGNRVMTQAMTLAWLRQHRRCHLAAPTLHPPNNRPRHRNHPNSKRLRRNLRRLGATAGSIQLKEHTALLIPVPAIGPETASKVATLFAVGQGHDTRLGELTPNVAAIDEADRVGSAAFDHPRLAAIPSLGRAVVDAFGDREIERHPAQGLAFLRNGFVRHAVTPLGRRLLFPSLLQ